MTHFLYTTIRPDQLLEVDDAEHADLAAQHLIQREVDPQSPGVDTSVSHVPTASVALDAAETLADDQPAARPSSSGG